MPEYGFYQNRIIDSVLIQEKRLRENPYSRIFYAVSLEKHHIQLYSFFKVAMI